MSGHFDKEEWDFECKRDDKAQKEREINKKWTEWGNKRLRDDDSHFAKIYNQQIADFVTAQINTEIAKLEGRHNDK